MGTCCFTPKKTDFLWWYWLLLFSVIGIPMFLAALYISKRAKREGTEKKYKLTALSIFFGASIISLVLVFLLLDILKEHPSFIGFLLGFVFCMLVATAACKAVEKHSQTRKRIAVLLAFVFFWYLIYVLPSFFLSFGEFGIYGGQGSVSTIIMVFAVCMLPAHYWHRFSVASNKKNAWIFLVAFVIGVFLFWVAVRYGNLANIYFYKLIRGQTPTGWEIFHKYAVY